MPVQGKFIVNNKAISPLNLYGVGVFPAFSGNKIYRNRGGCTGIVDNGPIPAGRYWIVDRPTGGIRTRLQTWAVDAWNAATRIPSDHAGWFALYRDDGMIDDFTWVKGVQRGQFRLHPIGGAGVSYGCITLTSQGDFQRLRRALLNTPKIQAGHSKLSAYGVIEVITYGKTCP